MSARIVAMGLIEAIDRADPTRSHEMKPSARMSRRRQEWRAIRAAFAALAGLIALCVFAFQLN